MTRGRPAESVFFMHGTHAFCPESGSTLSEDTVVTETGRELRYPTNDNAYGEDSYVLTTGATCSSTIALMSRFRECHEREFGTTWVDDERVNALYRRVALYLRQLKADVDGEATTRDEWIWFALAERLDREGDPADWMRNYADVVCPHCGGTLSWLEAPRGMLPKCLNKCDGTNRYLAHEIQRKVAAVYNRAFDERGVGLKPTEVAIVP